MTPGGTGFSGLQCVHSGGLEQSREKSDDVDNNNNNRSRNEY